MCSSILAVPRLQMTRRTSLSPDGYLVHYQSVGVPGGHSLFLEALLFFLMWFVESYSFICFGGRIVYYEWFATSENTANAWACWVLGSGEDDGCIAN